MNPAQLIVVRDTALQLPQVRLVLLPGGWGYGTIFHAEAWADRLGPFLAGLPIREAGK